MAYRRRDKKRLHSMSELREIHKPTNYHLHYVQAESPQSHPHLLLTSDHGSTFSPHRREADRNDENRKTTNIQRKDEGLWSTDPPDELRGHTNSMSAMKREYTLATAELRRFYQDTRYCKPLDPPNDQHTCRNRNSDLRVLTADIAAFLVTHGGRHKRFRFRRGTARQTR